MKEYLYQFVAARNTRASAALGELALVSNSFGSFCLLLYVCGTCDTLGSFRSATNLCLLKA